MQYTLYIYGMLHRGLSPGCQPMNGLVERRDSEEFHDVLVYDRQLTEQELYNYELKAIGTE